MSLEKQPLNMAAERCQEHHSTGWEQVHYHEEERGEKEGGGEGDND